MGISQNRLGELVSERMGKEVRGAYISRLTTGARGQRLDPALLFAVADALGVEPRWLTMGEGPKRDALLERYNAALKTMRDYVKAMAEARGKAPGKTSKLGVLVQDLERASAMHSANAISATRTRDVSRDAEELMRPTGTRGRS